MPIRCRLVAALLLLGACARPVPAPHAPVPASADARTAAPEPGWAAVRDTLLELGRRDQEVRDALVELISSTGGAVPDTAVMKGLAARMDSADRAHADRLKQIVARHGWPTAEFVGDTAVEALFLVVQHATHDRAMQREYLAFMEQRHRRNARVDPGDIALLTDRIRVWEGQKQLYGTQVSVVDGRVVVDPIEDEANVDQRRAALGLPPLAEYIRLLKEHYGLP